MRKFTPGKTPTTPRWTWTMATAAPTPDAASRPNGATTAKRTRARRRGVCIFEGRSAGARPEPDGSKQGSRAVSTAVPAEAAQVYCTSACGHEGAQADERFPMDVVKHALLEPVPQARPPDRQPSGQHPQRRSSPESPRWQPTSTRTTRTPTTATTTTTRTPKTTSTKMVSATSSSQTCVVFLAVCEAYLLHARGACSLMSMRKHRVSKLWRVLVILSWTACCRSPA